MNPTRIPMGNKFSPTSHILVESYLLPKINGPNTPDRKFVSDVIQDLDPCQFDPADLQFNISDYASDTQGYFFTLREQDGSMMRKTPNGYWKVCKDNIGIHNNANEIIGFKNKLVFYSGEYPNGAETEWKMTEYYTHNSVSDTNRRYILCKVRENIPD